MPLTNELGAGSAMDAHEKAVATLATDIHSFYTRKQPFRIYHGSTNSTRQAHFRSDQMIDTSRLSNILKIDTEQKIALMEPNVPMDALVEATLKCGLLPAIVMEFPGITVGGGFAGTAGESSSFRYGFFDQTVNWIEIIIPNGEVVTASATERNDLFFGAASSFGTLGVTTLLEIQLIEAKAYVELTYYPVSSMSEIIERIENATRDPSIEYLDGILFSKSEGVICTGHLRNDVKPGVKVQRFTRSSDPWFYIHARKLLNQTKSSTDSHPVVEAVPVVDYVFRYDRGGFWAAYYAFRYFITPFNRITRWALDYFMHTRVMYHALHQSGFYDKYIIQDVAVPYARAEELLQYLDESFGHYPLWICPLKSTVDWDDPARSKLSKKTNIAMPDFMLNFGVWGPGPKRRIDFALWNRKLERKLYELGGQKWLYAHAYYTKEEFDKIYDQNMYNALREKYHATHLPSVYDKVKVDIIAEEERLRNSLVLWLLALFWSIWPLSGLYGVYKAALGGDYLLPRSAKPKIKQV
jgi:delta24-sterol reductase